MGKNRKRRRRRGHPPERADPRCKRPFNAKYPTGQDGVWRSMRLTASDTNRHDLSIGIRRCASVLTRTSLFVVGTLTILQRLESVYQFGIDRGWW